MKLVSQRGKTAQRSNPEPEGDGVAYGMMSSLEGEESREDNAQSSELHSHTQWMTPVSEKEINLRGLCSELKG
jgi:hypothetical protein